MSDPKSAERVRVAMWSGPRNISTAMMRAFAQRGDTAVLDEPFYAAYLAVSGERHPLREEVLASQPNDWRDVVKGLLGPIPDGKSVWYQKHMTQHMLEGFGREWLREMRNAFLIRDPGAVLASYVRARGVASLADIGIVQQREMFEREADRLGKAPPVVEGNDVLARPGHMLERLCAALGIPYTEAMLRWPAGRRSTDGVWAPAWYAAVERSTCFAEPPPPEARRLPDELQRVADAAMPHYQALFVHRLR
jgi:hypothetical protein